MTRTTPLPADVAKTDKANTWTGTQDFTAATVLGISGGGGPAVTGATATAAGVVQLAGDLTGSYLAPTVAKINGAAPAPVATTGKYTDLTGRPALATVATTGAYTDLTGAPALATVATSGAYTDLTGRPALAPVATSGSYGDLTSRPLLAPVATSGNYADLTGAPAAPATLYKATDTQVGSTVTNQLDPALVGTVTTGTYLVELEFHSSASNTSAIRYTLGGTATWATVGTSGHRIESVIGTTPTGATANTQANTWDPKTLQAPEQGSSTAAGVLVLSRLTVAVSVTAAGTLGLAWGTSTNDGATRTVYAGGFLRLTKVA